MACCLIVITGALSNSDYLPFIFVISITITIDTISTYVNKR